MQRTVKQLVPTAQITAAAVTYYTAPADNSAEICAATATNVTGTARTVTVHLVASAGAAGATNIVVQTRTVPANSAVQLWELIGQKLPTGATIQALADAGAAVNLTIGGYEVPDPV
jgi:hypothetical protein